MNRAIEHQAAPAVWGQLLCHLPGSSSFQKNRSIIPTSSSQYTQSFFIFCGQNLAKLNSIWRPISRSFISSSPQVIFNARFARVRWKYRCGNTLEVQFSKSWKLTCDNHDIIIFQIMRSLKLWNDSEKRQSSDQNVTWKMWYLDRSAALLQILFELTLKRSKLEKRRSSQMNL